MPQNKKHHYVPRFYLKKFSENNGKTINIRNLKSEKTIFKGKLYNQCYKNFLYGEDDACEKALGVIEAAGAKVISSITDSKHVPRKITEQYFHLLVFVLLQKNRTLAAGEELNQQINNIHQQIFVDLAEPEASKLGITRQDLEEVSIGYEHPERAALGHAARTVPLVIDLNLKLLQSRGSLELITSDNPVVFYNPFALGARKREGSGTGLQSKGLQIYLPVSSSLTLLYYDANVYKIGNSKETVVIIDDEGVNSLNFLQVLNATENVYFQSGSMSVNVENTSRRATSRRSSIRSGVRTIPVSATSEIVHFYKKDINHKLRLSFCKLREQSPVTWDPRAIAPRDPEISKDYMRFLYNLNNKNTNQ